MHLLSVTAGVAHGNERRQDAIALLIKGRGVQDWELKHVEEIDPRVLPVRQLLAMEGVPGKPSLGRAENREGGKWWEALPVGEWLEPAQEAVGTERWVGGQ